MPPASASLSGGASSRSELLKGLYELPCIVWRHESLLNIQEAKLGIVAHWPGRFEPDEVSSSQTALFI